MEKRKIKLTFVNSNISVIAEMLEDEAPETCKLVWEMLPTENNLIHGRYSGAEVFILVEPPKIFHDENKTQLPLPGELLFWYDKGTAVTSNNKPVAEVLFVFNRGVTLRSAEGVPSHANLFARIPGDWKHDWEDFANACAKVRLNGTEPLLIEKINE